MTIIHQINLEWPARQQNVSALTDSSECKQEIRGDILILLIFLCAALHIMLIHFFPQGLFFFLISQKSFENWLWCPLNCCKWTELTGILLGCCSRISLTSSTRCSVGQKNRLGLMEMYKAGQVLIKHKWGQRRSRYKLANRGGLPFYYSTLKNTRMHWWVNETAFM